MTLIGLLLLILIIGTFIFSTVVVLRIDNKTLNERTADSNFPALRPISDRREDVRAHYKDTQAYLMEAWEVRFEAAVGASQLRDVFAKGTYEMEAMQRRRSKALESHFSPSVFGRNERSLKRQYERTFARITYPYDEEIYRYQRGIADVTWEYNTLMRRDREAKIPTWRWPH